MRSIHKRAKQTRWKVFSRRSASSYLFLACLASLPLVSVAQIQRPQTPEDKRNRYQIHLKIDFDALAYAGSEKVLWVNNSDHASAVLYFHLYSNLRLDQDARPGQQSPDVEEPRIEITEVRSADAKPLTYSIYDQGTTLRVNLREPVLPGNSTEVVVGFKGVVPEVDPDETGLTSHVVKQVSAALRGDRETRRPRDLNFRCRGVMLLGTSYPVLAVQDRDERMRKIEPSVGDIVFNEAADYEVRIDVAPGVVVFTSAGEAQESTDGKPATFAAAALRDFAVIAGRNLRSEKTQIGETSLRSIFIPEHERIGKRVLAMAEDAVRIFTAKFGPLPYKTITIAEAPLTAGLGSNQFTGMEVIASAYYVDFDSPAMRNLPEIIREQRPSVEESLEWSIAHLIAHEWWGGAVGNNPTREPVLDEGMASWAALLYFQEVYGKLKAAAVVEDQLRGVYRLYRTFGGEDMDANRPTRDYRNTFQYAAVVTTKGALMFVELQRLMGEEKLLAGVQKYYRANLFEIAELNDLSGALIAEAPLEQRRSVARTFSRWLASRHGDEDIAKPDRELATSLGLPSKPPQQRGGDRNPLSAFARVGKFFWQQVTRIR
ncbi:MAG TPA: M1 family aminopeptidase [Pyrinomonadaceae bacterium]|nr:M1 family aminopeptidase [Pyrinomonadaceae bacterium]